MSAHEVTCICGISMVFQVHISSWHIYGYNMVNERFFDLLCALMWGLHVEYIIRTVGHISVM